MNKTVRIALVALLCVGAAACSHKHEVKPEAPPPETQQAPAQMGDGKYTAADLNTDDCLKQRVVYFEFDKDEVKPEFQEIMKCHAKFLQDLPNTRVSLEGHTDERGTREYNLGLGERRAKAVSSALQAKGASSSQISVISYGKEHPVCQEHNEECWRMNRRVVFDYDKSSL